MVLRSNREARTLFWLQLVAFIESRPDCGAWEFATVPLAELDGLETQTEPRRLEPLRAHWDDRLYQPMIVEVDPLRIHEGNHRLTVARERGYRQIEIVWWRPAAYLAKLEGGRDG